MRIKTNDGAILEITNLSAPLNSAGENAEALLNAEKTLDETAETQEVNLGFSTVVLLIQLLVKNKAFLESLINIFKS